MKSILIILILLEGCGCPELVRAIDKYNEATNMSARDEAKSKVIFEEAKKLLFVAHAKCAFNQNDVARLYVLIARCYMEQDFFEHAAQYLDKAAVILEQSNEKTKPTVEEDLILMSIASGDMHYKIAKKLLKDIETGRAKETKLDLAIKHFQEGIVEYRYYRPKIINKDIGRFVDLRIVGSFLELSKTHMFYTDYRVQEGHLKEALKMIEAGMEICEVNIKEFSQFREDFIKYMKDLEKERDLVNEELGKTK